MVFEETGVRPWFRLLMVMEGTSEWCAHVNAVIKFQVPKFEARWLDSSATVGFSGRILLSGVN
jgi:hypothetical protein